MYGASTFVAVLGNKAVPLRRRSLAVKIASRPGKPEHTRVIDAFVGMDVKPIIPS